MLRKFVHSQQDVVQRMRQSLAEANMPEAELLAHTLKGLAGNLGAMRLSDSAGLLEGGLRRAPDATQLAHALAATDRLLQSLVQSLKQTPGFTQTQAVLAYETLNTQERQTGQQVLQEIKACLFDNNANALELWDSHATILRPLLPQWQQIESAIGAFEFESALELLNQEAA
jgi:two-component system sensor histidine kinase/response regulator